MRKVKSSILVYLSLIALFVGFNQCAAAQAIKDTDTISQPPDYARASDWVCRPGKEEVCTSSLDAKVTYPDGSSKIEPFVPAKDPAIDCFYIYPTISKETSDYADLADSSEIQNITRVQVGRLTSKCRVFAPIYRQATLQYISDEVTKKPITKQPYPQEDVLNAWEYYMRYENHGRGVVLIGHSQGTLLLQWLMQQWIDPYPTIRSLLVSAFLAGDDSLAVLPGTDKGVTFTNIPVCSSASQTGCAYVWGDYWADNYSDPIFGGRPHGAGVSACENPAAPQGGQGALKFFYATPSGSPPFTEAIGQVVGSCLVPPTESAANIFDVTILPGPYASTIEGIFLKERLGKRAGLHRLDLSLPQGNILDVLDEEIATWQSNQTNH